MCILLGLVTIGYDAPFKDSVGGVKTDAWVNLGDDPIRRQLNMPNGWVNLNLNSTCRLSGTDALKDGEIKIATCDTLNFKLDDAMRGCLQLANGAKNILRQTAPSSYEGAPDVNCISNADLVGVVMCMVVLFSLCVQAAEGLHYGIVPYISRPALGVVSGMVGAGGNLGAVISGQTFFTGNFRTDQGFINLGIMIISITLLIAGMYFPESGSMLFPAGGLGSYDPQLIKPPADYRGADVMDYDAAKKELSTKTANGNAKTVTVEAA